MKNYYELLGVSENAKTNEIINAFRAKQGEKMTAAEMVELTDAVEVLINGDTRKAYDEQLTSIVEEPIMAPVQVAEPIVKESPVEPVKEAEINKANAELKHIESECARVKTQNGKLRVCTYALAAIVLAGGIATLVRGCSHTESKTEEIVETNEEKETVKLTAENFNQIADAIAEDNAKKGLTIDKTFIKSALFVTNIDYLDQDDIKTIYAGVDMNIIEEIQNMYNYVSAVRTHNNNGKEYITMTDLAYDSEDKAVLEILDSKYLELNSAIKNNTITSEEYQASFKEITEFYNGTGSFVTEDGKSYSNYSMTSGGGLLSEMYWPMYSVSYMASEHQTEENVIDIQTLSTDVINGTKYLGSIVNHESLNCLVEENSNVKTLK